MDESTLENRLTRLESDMQYLGEEIVDLQDNQTEIKSLAMSVNTLALQVKRLVDDMCKVDGRLAAIESKPAQRWDSLVKTLITALVAGAVGYAISLIGG